MLNPGINAVRSENTDAREKQFLNFLSLFGMDETSADDYISARFKSPDKDLTASQKRGRLLAEQFIGAYNKTTTGQDAYHTVAWRSLFMPTEIMYAMDVLPFTTEMAAAQLAILGCQVQRMETAEENDFSQDICSFIRTAAGAVIEDIFPTPDILVTTSHLCDPSAKFASYAALKYRRPEFVLDIPYGIYGGVYQEDARRVEEAVDYLAGQFEDLARFIEAHTGATFDLDHFKQTIAWSNQARYWVQKGNAIVREKGTTAYKGSKDIDFAVNLMQTWGAPEVIDVYKSRHDEFAKGAEADLMAPDSPRILWYHLKPYFKNPLMSYIEEQIPIYATMVNFIYWEEMDPDDPFRSLARKTLLSPGYCPVSVRASLTAKRMRQGDGVIAFYPKSCRHFHSSAHIEGHTFKKAGIPFLAIDGDCIDNRGDDFAVLQTRLDRFIKKLRKGKTNRTA